MTPDDSIFRCVRALYRLAIDHDRLDDPDAVLEWPIELRPPGKASFRHDRIFL
jgi:hypothetical protein